MSSSQNDNDGDMQKHDWNIQNRLQSTDIPPGFSIIHGPKKQPVLVPTFLVPATQLALEVDETRDALNTVNEAPGISILLCSLICHFDNFRYPAAAIVQFIIPGISGGRGSNPG